jgi:hypothetical protein
VQILIANVFVSPFNSLHRVTGNLLEIFGICVSGLHRGAAENCLLTSRVSMGEDNCGNSADLVGSGALEVV